MTSVEWGIGIGERPRRVNSLRSHSALRTPHSPLHTRAGYTLIELLIVIMIITILAGLILGVAAIAGETAREAQSRHIVERLHTLLMEHYDTYKTRRVKLNSNVEASIRNKIANAGVRGGVLAEARLYALREMMLMEVPDRWSDVLLADVGSGTAFPNGTPGSPIYLAGRTDLSNVYLRRYLSLIDPNRKNTLTGARNTADEIKRNQGAECLYMIVTLVCGDGEARTLFAESSIGDVDGDGAPEFLDGWGHPINFLRWAPGFDSQIELNQNTIDQMVNGTQTTEAQKQIAKDHDPFDVFRVDNRAFRLVPLIYSPGRDESSGLNAATDYVTWPKAAGVTVNNNSPYLQPRLTPYELDPPNLDSYLGTKVDETVTDDIHNHLLGLR